ncbi:MULTISPECIES: LysR family transcriptional regulator [Pseudomonas]|jgi:DNA-binding transcriptional LysR family regulator|uniref:Putative transcriptional regulator n=6 Tax=Pseudomonas aeruginosa TaxID=287 RepID=OPRR_PSEAE|nr:MULTISPECIES: LysR family transcriptional regulator [Pseudomonas]NP_250910.1 transcriptional regulator [Pseudomonas aeruginosa PAO1]Q01610.2 RecName: Full=Putative transcriptional regulator [Pseudomonas aeruginosa PAO1]MDG0898709.1 LysR family transcriptional regulator [Pseudomonas sp. L01]AAG05608.1 probable transcriptional regulator [Pseudomonas aeruginosa PAO1]AGV59261.1 bacterial regulatory helix-turn-helix, lysR family protein [Pseudomonas aeruginosa PAO581]AGV66922.1 bacterial regula
MIKRNLNDLLSFVAVAREGTFTRAAAQLGVTQSALSQSISGLEARLQIRLLTRTTRSVSPTAAGERLLNAIGNRFDEIEAELDELSALRDKPSGTVRITCGDHIQRTLLLPRLTPLLLEYPDIKVEFDINYGFRDIVADRFDAGVRLGDTIDKDMIAVPIGPPVRMAVVAAPAYFAAHPKPRSPRDLVDHNCINMRMQSGGGLYAWDFQRKDRHVNVRVDGQLIFNTSPNIVDAALAGLGIAWLPEEEFAPHIEEGRLLRVLENWCPLFPGYYLYYPNRRQPSPAFSLVVDALRYTRPRGTTIGGG